MKLLLTQIWNPATLEQRRKTTPGFPWIEIINRHLKTYKNRMQKDEGLRGKESKRPSGWWRVWDDQSWEINKRRPSFSACWNGGDLDRKNTHLNTAPWLVDKPNTNLTSFFLYFMGSWGSDWWRWRPNTSKVKTATGTKNTSQHTSA